jgi:single-strand DNA-binding protein
MYHKIILAGNLGADPTMRYTAEGTPVTSFSVAVNERWTNQDGEAQERTLWFRISAWRRLAEICNQYLSKGRHVLVEGRMNTDDETGGPRVWTGDDGRARANLEVTALVVKFGPGGTREPETEVDVEPGAEGETDGDSIPF